MAANDRLILGTPFSTVDRECRPLPLSSPPRRFLALPAAIAAWPKPSTGSATSTAGISITVNGHRPATPRRGGPLGGLDLSLSVGHQHPVRAHAGNAGWKSARPAAPARRPDHHLRRHLARTASRPGAHGSLPEARRHRRLPGVPAAGGTACPALLRRGRRMAPPGAGPAGGEGPHSRLRPTRKG